MESPKRRAFTLVELLVVVAIIVVLLALLVPSLDKAVAAAERMKCGMNQKQFGVANHLYAGESKQQFVPLKQQTQGVSSASYYEAWFQNLHFAELMGITGSRAAGYYDANTGQWVDLSGVPSQVANLPRTPLWPAGLMCPVAPAHRLKAEKLWEAQGFNWSGQGGEADWGNAIVIRRSKVERPGDKCQMTDSNDWHVVGASWANRADYSDYWDRYGDLDWAPTRNAMVTYRHGEGAMLLHFDGHVEYYAKERAWVDPVERNANLWDVKSRE